MKLQIEHIAPYLPYGLQVYDKENFMLINVKGIWHDATGINYISDFGEDYAVYIWTGIRPLLLSLTPEQKYIYSNPITSSLKLFRVAQDQLFKEHYDVFGLIEKGLALNKNDFK